MLQRSTVIAACVLVVAIASYAGVEGKPVPIELELVTVSAKSVEHSTLKSLWANAESDGILQMDVTSLAAFPKAYRTIVPEFAPMFEFVDSLSEEEMALLKKGVVVTDWEELSDMEESHPALRQKIMKLAEAIQAKLDRLHPDALDYVEKIGYYLLEHKKELQASTAPGHNPLAKLGPTIRYMVAEFRKLSEEGKESLRREFPGLMGIAESEAMAIVYKQMMDEGPDYVGM